MKIIGITGLIGCGKTYLANLLRSIGYTVYDVDVWVRNLYKKDDFLCVIKQNFPSVFDSNCFNKKKLRDLVFNNDKELKKLEDIIYPRMKIKLKKLIRKFAGKQEFLFLDVSMLIKAGWDKYCDYIIVADVDKDIQIKRVIQRDNIKKEEVEKIIDLQSDRLIMYNIADYIINTALPDGINKVQLIKFLKEIM